VPSTIRCLDCRKSWPTERSLRTHQGRVHGRATGLRGQPKGSRGKRCECHCGSVHEALPRILGFRKVPLLGPHGYRGIVDPESGQPIEIFDATRSIDPSIYGLREAPLSGSMTIYDGTRFVEVGTFQREFPDSDRPGVRCSCPKCGHFHLRGSQ